MKTEDQYFNHLYLDPELVEKRGEVNELKKVAEDHLAGKMAPSLKRLASELCISFAPHALGELEGCHTETNQSTFNKLTRLKLLAIQTKDTVNGVFGVLLSYDVIENISLRGKERLKREREREREREMKGERVRYEVLVDNRSYLFVW